MVTATAIATRGGGGVVAVDVLEGYYLLKARNTHSHYCFFFSFFGDKMKCLHRVATGPRVL